MFSRVDSCIAVATAMTAARRPIFLAIAWRTMVVALSHRAGVIGIQACGPLVPCGMSSLIGACGLRAAAFFAAAFG